jgi:hypothetical protein
MMNWICWPYVLHWYDIANVSVVACLAPNSSTNINAGQSLVHLWFAHYHPRISTPHWYVQRIESTDQILWCIDARVSLIRMHHFGRTRERWANIAYDIDSQRACLLLLHRSTAAIPFDAVGTVSATVRHWRQPYLESSVANRSRGSREAIVAAGAGDGFEDLASARRIRVLPQAQLLARSRTHSTRQPGGVSLWRDRLP